MADFSNIILFSNFFKSLHVIVNNHFYFKMKHFELVIGRELKPEVQALSLC
jgi:hypothetical protein